MDNVELKNGLENKKVYEAENTTVTVRLYIFIWGWVAALGGEAEAQLLPYES